MYKPKRSIDPYHSMSKQKILPVEPLIQCEAGRAKTMQRQSLYSPRNPKWPPSDKRELLYFGNEKDVTELETTIYCFSSLLTSGVQKEIHLGVQFRGRRLVTSLLKTY